MRSHIALIAALSLAAIAPVATGCITQEEEAGQGAVALPLTQTGPDGALYQLTNATFEISGQHGTSFYTTGLQSSLDVSLPVGLATIRLLDGWTLTRTPATGFIAEPVDALLGTGNPVQLRVLANYSTPVSFGFIVRSTVGQAEITFGVVEEPRQLAGGVRIFDATGAFAPYLDSSANTRADFAFYYQLHHMDSVILPDGTKERVYASGYDNYDPTPVAGEFFNDAVGLLALEVGPSLAGGYLEYHIGAKPDGSVELYGSFSGLGPLFTIIDFGPYTLDVAVPLDADGFPADVFFHEDSIPFTMQSSFPEGDAIMSGTLNLRHIPR
jgi:hypothetical protein